jgi:hypothetical protein
MSNPSLHDNAVGRLAAQSDAVGRLAEDSGGFAAVVAAFESKDANAFRWVLERLEMLPYCELICEWVRIKLCVLRCVEICGPPREKAEVPSLQHFARAVAKLVSNEKHLRRVLDAVSCGDGAEYRAVLEELHLVEFCNLLCYWVCSIGYGRVCEVVCRPQPGFLLDAESELQAAGRFIGRVVENDKAFDAIAKAAQTLNCETLQSAINQAGFASGCEFICRLICVWRCVWICRELCELPTPILTGTYAIEEAQSFALAARPLAGQPRVLGDLVSAVQHRDVKSYREIVTRFNLGTYCWQVCAWVCSVTCYEFCICVCPPPGLQPIFTSVGSFGIYSDIDSTSGKTNTGSKGFGGPDYAFWDQLQLGGSCPSLSPIAPGVSMRYRFLYSTASTTLAGPISAAQTSITVTSSAAAPATPFNVAVCAIPGDPVEIITVNTVAATTWTVVRGQDGTAAAAAGIGATLAISPTPITGNLVSTAAPLVAVCSRKIPWAQYIPGIPATAGPTSGATPQSQQVIVFPTPPPPLPPDPVNLAPGATWVGPSPHFIAPDADGWIVVDPGAELGGVSPLLVFDSTKVAAGGEPVPVGNFGTGQTPPPPGCVPAGSAVPPAQRKAGMDLSIIFQATRVGVTSVDFSNALSKIHINNWLEVNELNFTEFASGCCTPIDKTLHVEFTVDHEELNSGTWSLGISSCSKSAPGNITPPNPTVGVTFTAGDRGASGTILEDTSLWCNCSYVVQLTTTPKLTTGLIDRSTATNQLTFAICRHSC